jgi:hypothetical protein
VTYECQAHRLTSTLLSEYIPSITSAISERFYSTARQIGAIDDRGYLVDDPRSTDVHIKILLQMGQQGDGDKVTFTDNQRASIGEIVNVLWAAHGKTNSLDATITALSSVLHDNTILIVWFCVYIIK